MKFKDSAGREWPLRINAGLLADVRRECGGFKLADVVRDTAALNDFLFGDPERLVQVLWVLCAEQARAAGVTPEAFGRSIDGPALEAAASAALEAVLDFSPRSKIAGAIKGNLRAVLAAMDRNAAAAVEELTAKLAAG